MITDFPGLSTLSAGDKVLLAAELFDEATNESEEIELNSELLTAIEERLANLEQNPDSGLTWDEVKQSLRRDG